jgi:uncharacterized protein (UPF0548 family)
MSKALGIPGDAGDTIRIRFHETRMFLTKNPDAAAMRRFLELQHDASFSYAEVGASQTAAPAGYNADHNRIRLGYGRETFERGIEAVKGWKMFDFDWIEVFPARAPIEVGVTVAILAHHLGFHSLNASRIVYKTEESNADQTYGFAYGTLMDHAEQGEERFTVEYHAKDESVWYDLFAFSRPRHPLAKAAYPLSRFLQRRFARESLSAMLRAVNE